MCPWPQSRTTAWMVFSSPTTRRYWERTVLKSARCTNPRWYPSLSFSGSIFQFAAHWCLTHPALSSISPSGERSHDRSISRVAAPEVLAERRAARTQAREDEPPIARQARDARQAVGALVERPAAPGVRDTQELAAQAVGPAVVRTGKGPRVALRGRAHHRPAVRAAVQKDRDAALAPSDHEHRLRAEGAGDEVAGPGNLALVAHEDPAAMKDPLHLVGEDPRIRVERHVNAIVLDERLVVDQRGAPFARRPRRARLAIKAPVPKLHGSASSQATTSFTRVPSSGAPMLTTSPVLWVNPLPGAPRSSTGANMVPMNRIMPSGYW